MGANQWTGLNDVLSLAGIKYWRGLWTNATQYVQGDGVRGTDGSAYVCILENLSTALTQPNTGANYLTYWSLLAQVGATGPTGATGATGPQGPKGDPGPGGGTNTGLDVVVAADGSGNYTTLSAALTAGYRRIFIKEGTYSEAAIVNSTSDLLLMGVDLNRVIIQSTASGGGSVGFTFTGARPRFQDITFRGTNANTTEMVLKISGDRPYLKNVRVDKGKNYLVSGDFSATNMLVDNCIFDGTGMTAGTNFAFTNFGVYGSKVVNSFIFMPTTVLSTIFTNCNFQVDNCLIRGEKMQIILNRMTNTVVQAGNLILSFDGANNLYSDFYTVTAPFVTINYGSHVGNFISCSNNVIKILQIDGQFVKCVGNRIAYGKDISINADGVMFCNNEWDSVTLPQTLNIQLTALATRCQVNHNIIRGEATSPIPTITDVGTNNNKLNNQLYV